MTTENNTTTQQGGNMPVNAESRRPPSFGRVFWAVIFIAAAAAIVLNRLVLPIPGISLGGFIILVIMVVILIASVTRLFWFGVFFPLAVIFWIVMGALGYNSMSDFGFWPVFFVALLLSIGFSILFKRKKTPKRWKNAYHYHYGQYYQHDPNYCYRDGDGEGGTGGGTDDGTDGEPGEKYKQVFNDPDGSDVYAGTKFGYAIKYINTDQLERGLLEVSAGTMKVFFDNAKIPSGTATIELRVNAGSMELFIPRAWTVVHQYGTRLSGIEEKGAPAPTENSPRLILTGEINISNLVIVHV